VYYIIVTHIKNVLLYCFLHPVTIPSIPQPFVHPMKETVVRIVAAVPILFGAAEAMIEGRFFTLVVTSAVLLT
jgi:hypothetical protein